MMSSKIETSADVTNKCSVSGMTILLIKKEPYYGLKISQLTLGTNFGTL